MNGRLPIIGVVLILVAGTGCNKDWLDKKPDASIAVPADLEDFQALLDNPEIHQYPGLGEAGADNYYVDQSVLLSLGQLGLDYYLWSRTAWSYPSLYEWEFPYRGIFVSNLVLEGLGKKGLKELNPVKWNEVAGGACFFRALAYYGLVEQFANVYNAGSANTDLGVPLRLSSNVNEKQGRASVQSVYDQVLSDLSQAAVLLPTVARYKTRPVKAAAYGLLSRVYLSIDQYDSALKYSHLALSLYDKLLDYNDLIYGEQFSLPQYYDNPEVIFYTPMLTAITMYQFAATVDSTLYRSYANNDLRKQHLFRDNGGRVVWAGNYSGNVSELFGGIAASELFLIQAEVQARKGATVLALETLNKLLAKRYPPAQFVPVVAGSATEALQIVLRERRKETAFRGLRWSDLRRFNKQPATAVAITRVSINETVTLQPGDKKYAWMIPPSEVLANAIPQNPR